MREEENSPVFCFVFFLLSLLTSGMSLERRFVHDSPGRLGLRLGTLAARQDLCVLSALMSRVNSSRL